MTIRTEARNTFVSPGERAAALHGSIQATRAKLTEALGVCRQTLQPCEASA